MIANTMRKTGPAATAAFGLSLLCCLSTASAEPHPITVDCSRGPGIADALRRASSAARPAARVIEIHGMCEEDVVLDLDGVTLRGTDPAVDGIRGVGSSEDPTTAVLTLSGASGASLENLAIAGGARNGLVLVGGSDAELTNCRLADNGRYGLWLGQASRLVANATSIAGNGRGGMVVTDGSEITCVDCDVRDDALFAVWAQLGARVVVRHSEIESTTNWSVIGYAASEISMQDSSVAGAPYGLVTRSHDGVRLTRVELNGAVWLDAKSSLELFDATQISNPRTNYVFKDSSVRLDHGSTLTGPTLLEDFSTLSIRGQSAHAGDLYCSSASDAFCEDGLMVGGGVYGCPHCPPAAAAAAPTGVDRTPTPPGAPAPAEPELVEPQRR